MIKLDEHSSNEEIALDVACNLFGIGDVPGWEKTAIDKIRTRYGISLESFIKLIYDILPHCDARVSLSGIKFRGLIGRDDDGDHFLALVEYSAPRRIDQ